MRENRKKERKAEKRALRELEKLRKEKDDTDKVNVTNSIAVKSEEYEINGLSQSDSDKSCTRLVTAIAVSTLSAFACFYLRNNLLLTLSL